MRKILIMCLLSMLVSCESTATSMTPSVSIVQDTTINYVETPEEYASMRRNPITTTGDVGYIYNYDGSVYKTLYKGNYYTELEDVAGYIIAFNELPINYYRDVKETDTSKSYNDSKAACYAEFSTACRISPGSYYSNYTYLPNTFDGTYCEADIGYGSYATASTWGRGMRRIVWGKSGIDAYGRDISVVFYTDDHYYTFKEYGNYHESWGTTFGGGKGAWQMMPTISI